MKQRELLFRLVGTVFENIYRISIMFLKRITGWKEGLGPSTNELYTTMIVFVLLWLTITNSTWVYYRDFLQWSLGSTVLLRASKGAVDTYQEQIKGGRSNDKRNSIPTEQTNDFRNERTL